MTEIVVSSSAPFQPGLFQSMFNAYSVLVDNAWALFLFVVGWLCIISEINNSYGPLELASNALLEYCNGNGPFIPVAKFLLLLINWIIPIKIQFFLCIFFIIPAVIKGDTATWLTSITFCFVSIFTGIPTYQLFLFSQFYFMYCFVQQGWYKFLIFFFAFIILIIGFTHISNMLGIS